MARYLISLISKGLNSTQNFRVLTDFFEKPPFFYLSHLKISQSITSTDIEIILGKGSSFLHKLKRCNILQWKREASFLLRDAGEPTSLPHLQCEFF
jgi:hypothetical protein